MDAGDHRRPWEHNDSTIHTLTSHPQNPNERARATIHPTSQTPFSERSLPQNRTLPSLSSVFEGNSLTQEQHGNQSYGTSIASEHGLKRPRLSHDQGQRAETDAQSDICLVTTSVSAFGIFWPNVIPILHLKKLNIWASLGSKISSRWIWQPFYPRERSSGCR